VGSQPFLRWLLRRATGAAQRGSPTLGRSIWSTGAVARRAWVGRSMSAAGPAPPTPPVQASTWKAAELG
jgi:hypothetical protein